jgi:non-canonical (house-cleaning) NTP pyrophosphatase
MKIVLASTSGVKVAACKAVFGDAAELVTVKAPSNVNEQPLNDETLTGAFNRLSFAREAARDADWYIAIENGLFLEDGAYVDRAVVVIENAAGERFVAKSDGVTFPTSAVHEAMDQGLDKVTVGQVMKAWGIVAQHDDPHKTLGAKPRAEYIDDALRLCVAEAGLRL